MTSSLMILAATYCFALAGFHLMFWRLFSWPASLAASGTINVGVTQTLNLMLTLGVTIYGAALLWGAFHLTAPAGRCRPQAPCSWPSARSYNRSSSPCAMRRRRRSPRSLSRARPFMRRPRGQSRFDRAGPKSLFPYWEQTILSYAGHRSKRACCFLGHASRGTGCARTLVSTDQGCALDIDGRCSGGGAESKGAQPRARQV